MQTTLDFTHHCENNAESQKNYDDNIAKFSGKCHQVLELLRSGERLTVLDAHVKHGISSLPRRILDIRSKGIDIKDCWIEVGESKVKQYYI